MMYPLLARSVRAQGRARRRLLSMLGVGRGGDLLPRPEPKVEAESETSSRGRSLRSDEAELPVAPEAKLGG
jgi:hypothetical protein